MLPMRSMTSALLLNSVLVVPAPADPNEVTFDRSGELYVGCACVAATSGCKSRLLAALADQKVTWTQVGSAREGATIDLTEWCFRRRDVAGHGEGLCCSAGDEYSANAPMFQGSFQEIR